MSCSTDSNAPRANKRFLSSIIKSTDEHNKTILKAQAQAAEDLKREKREQERRQRKVRAEEAAAAEKLRRKGKRRHTEEDEGWDRWDGRTAERRKVSRNWETWDGYDDDHDLDSDRNGSRKRRRSRSRDKVGSSRSKRSGTGDKEKAREEHSTSSNHEHSLRRRKRSSERNRDKRDDNRSRQRRRRDDITRHSQRSASRSHSSSSHFSDRNDHKARKRKQPRSPKHTLDNLRNASNLEPSRHTPQLDAKLDAKEAELRQKLKDSRKESLESESKDGQHDILYSRRSLTPMTISRSPSLGPERPLEHVPSKMDRYFEESYDPRLDVGPLVVPQVPAAGLVSDADFESWDVMLELIRLRREDKAEKKRLERLGIFPTKHKVCKGVSTSSSGAVAERWNSEGVSVMNIEYSKKGTVREWDLGKEGF